jgi:hypothetical protein
MSELTIPGRPEEKERRIWRYWGKRSMLLLYGINPLTADTTEEGNTTTRAENY